MKKNTRKYLVTLPLFILLLLWFNDLSSYSRRIGNTGFYLVETMAVEMPGFPKAILWNDKYLISKNYDGNSLKFSSYVIINLNSVNASDGNIEDIHIFITEADYYTYLQQTGLSESNMNQTDNHIAWWEVIL